MLVLQQSRSWRQMEVERVGDINYFKADREHFCGIIKWKVLAAYQFQGNTSIAFHQLRGFPVGEPRWKTSYCTRWTFGLINGLFLSYEWGSIWAVWQNFILFCSDYVRVMDMGLLELTIRAVKPGSDGERVRTSKLKYTICIFKSIIGMPKNHP